MSSLTLDAGVIPLPRRSRVPSGDRSADDRTDRADRAERTDRPADDRAEMLKALVLRARDGDAEAFGSLYDHYVELVYRYVYYRVAATPSPRTSRARRSCARSAASATSTGRARTSAPGW
ncbi:hypothetical protein [Actinomadura sp. CNU-125]|uniref:hypothetical protein n=1 Tax=Actinomadura sp. CNU-125 TaxID=1904961 RepID=UPI000AF970D4|nr:hypothetical protein [Actinomadura sp. CNU-125]